MTIPNNEGNEKEGVEREFHVDQRCKRALYQLTDTFLDFLARKSTVHSLFVPAVLLIFEHSQRPILLSKFKNLTNTAGTIKGRVQITNLR